MIARIRSHRQTTGRRFGDEGVSLVEMIVATLIFTIILGIITTSIVTMLGQSQRENGQANDLDASRKVISLLDHQVRYANALSQPGNTSYSSGCVAGTPCFVEWRTGNLNEQQTCTQWRFTPSSGDLDWRTWQPPITGSATVSATAWTTAAIGLSPVGANQIFSLTSSADTTATSIADNSHYALTMQFNATSGAPAITSASQVTVTAINSTRLIASPTPPSVCTEVSRS